MLVAVSCTLMPRRRRLFAIALTIVGCLMAAAGRTEAASLPPDAQVRIGPRIDVANFRRTVSSRYHVEFRRVIATDIDRDGDIDVVATTDHGFSVWVNDGSGRLTSQTPSSRAALHGESRGTTFEGQDRRHQESMQDDVVSVSLVATYAHAPPADVTVRTTVLDPFFQSAAAGRDSSPRAPPA